MTDEQSPDAKCGACGEVIQPDPMTGTTCACRRRATDSVAHETSEERDAMLFEIQQTHRMLAFNAVADERDPKPQACLCRWCAPTTGEKS